MEEKKAEQLTQVSGEIETDELAIIFGITNKLQSYDPYLFYFYEFRIHCIKSRLMICSGYGFLDEHINDVIKHGFDNDKNKRLIVNIYEPVSSDNESGIKKEISEKLLIHDSQIIVYNKTAKEFYNEDLKLNSLSKLFPENDEDLPIEF